MNPESTSKNILGFSYPAFLASFKKNPGRGAFHAKALFKQVMTQGLFKPDSLSEFQQSSGLAEKVKACFHLETFPVQKRLISDGTKKLAFQTQDHHLIESVVVPMPNYKTLCISSQIGCKLGCSFCQTGTLGFIRNLETWELVAQVFHSLFLEKEPVRNIAFMGMGEPLDNFSSVVTAIHVFTDDHGFNFKKDHITLSTAGHVDGLNRLASLNLGKIKIAISLNAGNDILRNQLMPLNRKWNLSSLKQCLQNYPLHPRDVFFIEYVLIKGINDSLKDANQLKTFVDGLKVRINLIPYNPGTKPGMQPPSQKSYDAFFESLKNSGFHTTRRATKGDLILAACGQLGSTACH